MAEKDIQPDKCLKKGVRFGKNEEIPYESTFEGGYAYTAVKATKLNENKNRRRTLELILKPDKFSINFIHLALLPSITQSRAPCVVHR